MTKLFLLFSELNEIDIYIHTCKYTLTLTRTLELLVGIISCFVDI